VSQVAQTADPCPLQLRLLQTVVEVAAEKNSTLVMPFPVELLRFFDRARPADSPSLAATDADDAGVLPVPAALPAPVPATQPASPQADPQSAPLNGSRKADSTG
jgi:hypothetical protein